MIFSTSIIHFGMYYFMPIGNCWYSTLTINNTCNRTSYTCNAKDCYEMMCDQLNTCDNVLISKINSKESLLYPMFMKILSLTQCFLLSIMLIICLTKSLLNCRKPKIKYGMINNYDNEEYLVK